MQGQIRSRSNVVKAGQMEAEPVSSQSPRGQSPLGDMSTKDQKGIRRAARVESIYTCNLRQKLLFFIKG